MGLHPRLHTFAAARLVVYNVGMSRTFSLARLLLYVTLIAVALGLLVNFPDATAGVLHALVWACVFSPLLLIWLGLNDKSRSAMAKFIASFAGCLAGIYFMRILIENKHLTFNNDARSLAGWVAIVAISVAFTFLPIGAVVLGEYYWRRYRQ